MRIKEITIKNFKGLKGIVINLPYEGVMIRGCNASGKTTIADAYFWTLTGRNYAGLTDDKGGFKAQNLKDAASETYCKVTFDNDGTLLSYGKVLTAKGKLQYYVNGVEFQAKEYEKHIVDNVSPMVALMCNPGYFATLSWQEQRALVAGLNPVHLSDLSDNKQLIAELETKDVETWRKSAKKAIENSKSEIASISSSIETISSLVPDTTGADDAKKQIAEIDVKIATLYSDMNKLSADDVNRAKLAEMRANIQKFVNDNKSDINKLESDKIAITSDMTAKLSAAQCEIDGIKSEIAHNEGILDGLRKKFNTRAAEMFPDENDDVVKCPLNKEHCCADMVLNEIIKNQKRDLVAKFYEQKENNLNAIEEEGKLIAAKINELKSQLNDAIGKRDIINKTFNEQNERLMSEIQTKRDNLNAEYTKMVKDADDFEKSTRNPNMDAENLKTQNEISDLNAKRDLLTKSVNAVEIAENYKKQIAEKNIQLDAARLTLETNVKKLADGEQLIDRHAAEIERRVNTMFSDCQFQMFETLKNGTRQNTCAITIDGVPYGRGANRAAETAAGIEICHVFQEHFKMDLPIFIDNAESINSIDDHHRQTIQLYVDECELTADTFDTKIV